MEELQINSEMIGFSYHGLAVRFDNVIGITAGIPTNSKFPRERNLVQLSMPYKAQLLYAQGKITRPNYELLYREIIRNSIPDMQEFLERIIDQFGDKPVFLGLHKDPEKCFRPFLMNIINEETRFNAKEVTEQFDLLDLDISNYIG